MIRKARWADLYALMGSLSVAQNKKFSPDGEHVVFCCITFTEVCSVIHTGEVRGQQNSD